MRMRRKLALAATAGMAGLTISGTAAAAQPAERYQVQYGLPAIVKAAASHLIDPDGIPPGANDWSCKPSKAHPNPVVLVHGASANAALNWSTIAPLLKNNGYCVYALNYGFESELLGPLSQIGGTSRMEVSAARDLAPFVDKVRASTGARKVDLVGHSEGTAMPRYYLNYLGGAAKVDKSVNLAPLWQGSKFYGVDVLYQLAREAGAKPLVRGIFDHIYPAEPQLLTGSDYINKVNTGEAFPHEVTYTSIVTKYDEAVAPYTNGLAPALPNTRNIVVQDQCPADLSEHGLLATDPVAAQDILNALDPRHAEPVDCQATPRNSS